MPKTHNPYAKVRQWPVPRDDRFPEPEFIDRYEVPGQPGGVVRRVARAVVQQVGKDVSELTAPGGVVENAPVGIRAVQPAPTLRRRMRGRPTQDTFIRNWPNVGPLTPTVRQARFVNLAATVGLVSTQLLASNQKRSYLLVQNTSGSTIFLTFDRPASLASGIQVIAGGNYEPLTPSVSSVWAISLVANLTCVIIEGTT